MSLKRMQFGEMVSVVFAAGGFLSPLLVVLACVMFYLAGGAIGDAAQAISSYGAVTQEKGGQVKVVSDRITEQQALVAAQRLRALVPGVSVATSADAGLVLAVKSPEQFPEFMAALAMVSAGSSIKWQAQSICMNVCAAGDAAQAKLSGYKQAVRVVGDAAGLEAVGR